jgi:hypothetical protein
VLVAKGNGVARVIGLDAAEERLEALAVVVVNAREKFVCSKRLSRIEAEELRSIGAALRCTAADVQDECGDRARAQCLLQEGLALGQRSYVPAALGEQRGENVGAERYRQDAGAGREHAVRHRQTGIAEVTDADCRGPDDRQGNDEGRCRAKTGRQRAAIHSSTGNSRATGTAMVKAPAAAKWL